MARKRIRIRAGGVGGSRTGSAAAALSGAVHTHSLQRINAGGYNQGPKTENRINKNNEYGDELISRDLSRICAVILILILPGLF